LDAKTIHFLCGDRADAVKFADRKVLDKRSARESESLDLWNSFEPVTVTDQRRKTFNVRSEMITRCKLNIQKYRETIAALEEQAGK
jgi:hypothetical protein